MINLLKSKIKKSKVNISYDPITKLVVGNYPHNIKYKDIPKPFITIKGEDQILDKTMCVIDGIYQEFVKSDSELLKAAKDEKILKVKANRFEANQKPTNSCQAFEIIDNGNGSFTTTRELKYFTFNVIETGETLTNSSNIINSTARGLVARYSCAIIEGKHTRKGYVEIDTKVSKKLEAHLAIRAQTNVSFANGLEKEINNCTTIEEINNIDIKFN